MTMRLKSVLALATRLILLAGGASAQSPQLAADAGSLRAGLEQAMRDLPRPDASSSAQQATREARSSFQERAGTASEWAVTGAEVLGAWQEFRDANAALDAANDARLEPDYSPEGMPQVPISCPLDQSGGNAACLQCYEMAIRKADANRRTFERLRIIGQSTASYTAAAIALGDAGSSIHGYSGLVWQTQIKPPIVKALEGTKAAYRNKYRELLGALSRNLTDISKCETEYFNNPDWYGRTGFIFYSFMEFRYAPDVVMR